MIKPSQPNMKKVKRTGDDLRKLRRDTEEDLIVAEFNLAGWDLETIALFSRRMQTALAESMREPDLLLESIEAARQVISAIITVVPRSRIQKLDKKLLEAQEETLTLLSFLSTQGIQRGDVFLNVKFRELRERVRKLITEVNDYRGKYGLSIPTKVAVSDQRKIEEIVEEI